MSLLQVIMVVPHHQEEAAKRLVDHCRKMDGTEIRMIHVTKAQDDAFHPKFPDNRRGCLQAFSFHKAATAAKGKPFLWLEPDCIPLKPGWIKAISKEYDNCGKPFLMPDMTGLSKWEKASGNGVYSGIASQIIPREFEHYTFDLWLQENRSDMIARTRLIQHSYGVYELDVDRCQPHRFPRDSALIRPESVMFHRDKFQDLIASEPIVMPEFSPPSSLIGCDGIRQMLDYAATTPPGCFIEVGVYKGGSAFHLASLAKNQGREFYGYDTFTGIPFSEKGERHKVGDFSDTSYEAVCAAVPTGKFIKGLFPSTLIPGDYLISFIHLDVDQRQSYEQAIDALYPRLQPGGIMWFDEPDNPNFISVADLCRARFGSAIEKAPCGKWFVRKGMIPNKPSQTFYHTGCIGDIIASLPIVRSLGGGSMIIGNHDPMMTGGRPMEGKRFASLAPLLSAQPYISGVTFNHGAKADFDFQKFRQVMQPTKTLTESQVGWIRKFHEVPPVSMAPWLTVTPSSDSKGSITIARTHRYRNNLFPWRPFVLKHGKSLIFLGYEDEYKDFIRSYGGAGKVRLAKTTDLLRMAELIAGSALFVGNQSCHCWIAMGLGHPLIQETFARYPDSIVKRDNLSHFVSNGDRSSFARMGVPI